MRCEADADGQWHVDPARVGMIGFSAGAITSLIMDEFRLWLETNGWPKAAAAT